MKRRILSFLATLIAIAVMTGAAEAMGSVPVVNFKNQTWVRVDNKKLTKAEIRQAIMLAVQGRKWVIQEPADGRLLATIHVRGKHTVVVAISYTETSFDVVYESSDNMNYKKQPDGTEVIHPNYNRWVQYLVTDITNKLASFGK